MIMNEWYMYSDQLLTWILNSPWITKNEKQANTYGDVFNIINNIAWVLSDWSSLIYLYIYHCFIWHSIQMNNSTKITLAKQPAISTPKSSSNWKEVCILFTLVHDCLCSTGDYCLQACFHTAHCGQISKV